MSVLSIDEARKLERFYKYKDGVYKYQTADGFYHLIIGGKDVLAGLDAVYCHYYGDGVYGYKIKGWFYHLIIGDRDVLDGLNATDCHYYGDGVCWYKTVDGFIHLIIGGKDVLAGLNATWCYYYGDGVCEYKTADGFYHLIIDGKDVLAGLNATWYEYRGDGVYMYQTADGISQKCKVNLNKGGKMSVLSIDEARKLERFYECKDGVYEYQTADGFYHLIIDGKDILAGLDATDCHYYGDGVYWYQTADGVLQKCKVNLNKWEVIEKKNANNYLTREQRTVVVERFIKEKPLARNVRAWCVHNNYPISAIESAVGGYTKANDISQRTAIDLMRIGKLTVDDLSVFWRADKPKKEITTKSKLEDDLNNLQERVSRLENIVASKILF